VDAVGEVLSELLLTSSVVVFSGLEELLFIGYKIVQLSVVASQGTRPEIIVIPLQ
jgi:hypothetical protein